MKKGHFIILFFIITSSLFAQESKERDKNNYQMDFVMGPYLILDGTIYESVFLNGVRIAYETERKLAYGLEYLVGNQEDLKGELGTTHSAFGYLRYYFHDKSNPIRFRPYGLAGGGFFEFKDFSADVLGIAFYLSIGTEINISSKLKGFIEPRYLNLGLMDANGTHQLGVMWGLSLRF